MEKIITVDKFFGLNESADGTTELKPGEASKIVNFYITDEYNMKSRPGIVSYSKNNAALMYDKAIPVYEGDKLWLCCANYDQGSRDFTEFYSDTEDTRSFKLPGWFYKLISFSGKVTSVWRNGSNEVLTVTNTDGTQISVPAGFVACSYYNIAKNEIIHRAPYEPLVMSGSAPSGGGEPLEKLNILTPRFRVGFAGDGTSKDYVLPGNVDSILSVSVDGTYKDVAASGEWKEETHTFTFATAPEAQTEVVFRCTTSDPDLRAAMERFLMMKHHEYYNGATDTRIFFYGDGTNITYYTGVPAFGDGLYVPAGNELAVDFSDSGITGMIRHYSRLLVFKPDGVEAITYEPMTLADGSVIPAFYLHPVSRAFGNDAMGQVCLVNNSPRTFTGRSIYEWRVSSSSYRDERYAKDISQKVASTIASADTRRIVAFDDNADQTYYVFLNDKEGTVLVNRYNIDCWTIYRSELTKNVSAAFAFDGKTLFISDKKIYTFDENARYDEGKRAIEAVYESGFLSFGADYKRKYSSRLWLSLSPQVASQLDITVKTDKRGEYMTKTVGYSLLDFSMLDFSNFSFETYSAPKIRRVQMKVKKFVYYKLILKVSKAGARATILGYDQQVRFASDAK